MRVKIFLAFCLCIATNMIGANKEKVSDELISRLAELKKSGIMIGHQDDPVYGRTWKWELNRSDIKDVTGDYPAVMGFDLGWIECDSIVNLDHVPFERIRREIILQHERGGIVTLSWHPTNIVTRQSAWDPNGNAINKVLHNDTYRKKFEGWLAKIAAFLSSLQTQDGRKVPIIFRPWHEMSGGWFWWGKDSCSPEEYKQFYQLTKNILEGEHKLQNIVWSFSPGGEENLTEEQYLKYYPGDEYVDIIGIDLYDFNADNAKYSKQLSQNLKVLNAVGKKHHKLVALTETGAQQLPDSRWFTNVLWKALKPFSLSYVLFWRNAWDNPKEIYMTSKGHRTEADFKRFYRLKKTLFVNDLKTK